MATRCAIILKANGEESIIHYCHCDGYLSGVGKFLKEEDIPNIFIKKKAKKLKDISKELHDKAQYETIEQIPSDVEYIYELTFDFIKSEVEYKAFECPLSCRDFTDYINSCKILKQYSEKVSYANIENESTLYIKKYNKLLSCLLENATVLQERIIQKRQKMNAENFKDDIRILISEIKRIK